ncbi:metallophosphoesterase family protein [Maridesulfovibrio hydrothermalis]|uniref:Metallophosphoesterase n=1 Tax=Maridesulfovibrio hydrothermalis AM13 = DSM 14728 TaxID=1121451 RepID=L0R8M8_9BACT|nr:metallophosphoesterase [Maridesulfovibrio hydrothermalis]CCO23123.1 Metallophosphoesterase [Maridesulfovibrio hydrothermalis AM13 = DSM 14728]
MSENTINWIAFGDIHQSLNLPSLIPDIEKAATVIVTGDLTNHSPHGAVEKVWDSIYKINPRILAQAGNMDRSNVTDFLKTKNANLHMEVHELAEGIKIMGVGCSIPTPFGTPSEVSEEEMSEMLDRTYAKTGEYDQLILAVHDSPYNTAVDIISNGMHVGSKSVRAFIEKVQPDLVICGHIHESSGVDNIGKSHIINPGMASGGGYVLISLADGKLSADLKQV